MKEDGLALGKGVLICKDLEEAKAGVKEIMLDKKFGTAGNEMVIEEFMTGREVSVLSFVDELKVSTFLESSGTNIVSASSPFLSKSVYFFPFIPFALTAVSDFPFIVYSLFVRYNSRSEPAAAFGASVVPPVTFPENTLLPFK